jgi:hypothetical protein
MDEVFGYLPPTANPASKLPLLTLLKQARAYGLGVVLATQNPVDLDYKALGNAGTWFLGRLQTERDRARVVDGLESAAGGGVRDRAHFEELLGGLGKRVFLVRSAHEDEPILFQTRWTLSYLRGPLTREDVRRLRRRDAPAFAPPASLAAPIPAAAPEAAGLETGRPLLAPGIEQVFLPGAAASYRPALLAEAQLHYASPGAGVDSWERVRLLVPFAAGETRPRLEAARELPASLVLGREPVAGARFLALPPEAALPARYTAWGRELRGHLQRARPLRLLHCAAAKLSSRPGESEGEFRVRLRGHVHELRDRALAGLREQYARRLETARARLAAARARLEREGDQYRDQKLQTAVSVGASVIGALFGRRRSGLGGAATAARAAGRAARERGDVGRAEDQLRGAEQALAALEAELDASLEALRGRFGEDALALEVLEVAPRKGDLSVERVALAWEPA